MTEIIIEPERELKRSGAVHATLVFSSPMEMVP